MSMDNDWGLNPRQMAFVDAYLLHGNGTKAALDAGYSNRGARQQAHSLLTNPAINQALEAKRKERALRVGVSQDSVLFELCGITYTTIDTFFDEAGAFIPPQRWNATQAKSVQSIEVSEQTDEDGRVVGRTYKIKLWDKIKALELIGRHIGMFRDSVDVNVNIASALHEARKRVNQGVVLEQN